MSTRMTMIPAEIFRKYDIRGDADGDQAVITPEVARLVGRAFGTYLRRADQTAVVVGHDNRLTSEALAAAAIDGLQASGLNVIDIGLAATPVLYWHAVQRGHIGGLMITGSHLTPDKNGFKLGIGVRSLYGDQITALRTLIEADDFIGGDGSGVTVPDARQQYLDDLAGRITMQRQLKVVIDAGNGIGGLFGPQLVSAWGHDVVACLFCEPDGRYPNHQPDPQKAKNVRDLSAAVVGHRADVGLAFDGDADRVGVVDDQGNLIAPDRVLTLLARDLLARHPGAKVIADVSSSQVVFDTIAAAGGEAIMWLTGHSFVKAKLIETGALLAGEMSGHIFLAEDYPGFDDGFFAAGRLLQLIANSDQPLSALDASIPRLHSTPVYRPHCPPHLMHPALERIQTALAAEGEITAIDGVRIKFANGWGGIRASNTEPVLSMRFEAATEADALAYRDQFVAVLRAFPEIDLSDIDC
ncbi:MAG: phosphomannomutase/phosphoglucomutase [Chloroflexi bacterium]|nr:phosphomannomutase/phosphoglucomutase [Chloroflexota bacterium]